MKLKLFILFLCVLPAVSAYNLKDYPTIFYERGVNYTKLSSTIHKIDSSLMEGIKQVTFHNHDMNAWGEPLGYYSYRYYIQYPYRKFDHQLHFYNSASDLSDESLVCLFYHELGHYYNIRLYDDASEEKAEEYALKYSCMLDDDGKPIVKYDVEQYTIFVGDLLEGQNTIKIGG